ncbi:MAG: sulfurtransferase TusA family protein [Myxococcales bacterium]|nr:sulfurtransferase TusA family protein [Myxococcales bacterium]
MADVTLDCRGLNCPIPIVKISKSIKAMEKGQQLEVVATDPAFEADLQAWAKRLKHKVVALNVESDSITAVIEKS